MTTLDNLKPGQGGRILSLKHGSPLAERLMEMGLLEGEKVEVLRSAPLGDPLELRVSGYHLSIRKSEAKFIEVEV